MCFICRNQSRYRSRFGPLFINNGILQDRLNSFFALRQCRSCLCRFPYQLMHQFHQKPKARQYDKNNDHRNNGDDQTIS